MREAIPAIKALAFCDAVAVILPAIARRLDAFAQRRHARLRAEAEEEERQIADALPDPDMPQEWDAPPPPGELHTHPPTAETTKSPHTGDQSGTDPVLEPALDPDDAEGDLPKLAHRKDGPSHQYRTRTTADIPESGGDWAYVGEHHGLSHTRTNAPTRPSPARDALSTWGIRAPGPVLSDDPRYPEQYRRQLAYLAKKRLPEDHELRQFQVKHCPRDVFEAVEPQIFAVCKETGHSNDSVPPGQMRMVETRNPQNGQRIINFYGQESFVKEFTRPGRRVVSFNTSNGPVDASGRFLRR